MQSLSPHCLGRSRTIVGAPARFGVAQLNAIILTALWLVITTMSMQAATLERFPRTRGYIDSFASVLAQSGIEADLTVTIDDSSDPVDANQPITYTITVANLGPDTAQQIQAISTLWFSYHFISSTLPCTDDGFGLLTCELGALANGESRSFQIVLQSNAFSTVHHNVTVTSELSDPNNANDSDQEQTTVMPPSANLQIEKTASTNEVVMGETVRYTLTAVNLGADSAQFVMVIDSPPVGFTFVAADRTCDATSGSVSCAVGTLAAGETFQVQLTFQAPTGPEVSEGELTSEASITSNTADPDSTNNRVTLVTRLLAAVNTTITAAPPLESNERTASFVYSGVINGAPATSFECALNDAAFAACAANSQQYANLADGRHTFRVRAIGPNNAVDPSPAEYRWLVDTTSAAPNVTIRTVGTSFLNEFQEGPWNQLALDSQRRPHLVYNDEGILRYAYWDGVQWQRHSLPEEAQSAQVNRPYHLHLDAEDRPHLYWIYDETHVKIAHWLGTQWQVDTLYGIHLAGGEKFSLVVDSNGHPHVSYLKGEFVVLFKVRKVVRYDWWDGAAWHSERAFNDPLAQPVNATLTLDANNRPHLAVLHEHIQGEMGYRGLQYAARNTSGVWSTRLVEPIDFTKSYQVGLPTLAVNSSSAPHLIYPFERGLRHAFPISDSNWQKSSIDAQEPGPLNILTQLTAAFNAQDLLVIAYYNATLGNLRLAIYQNTLWQAVTIEREGDVGADPVLLVDGQNHFHLGYNDLTNSTLHYAVTNRPPTANAGADQSVAENAAVSLAGRGYDPDGDELVYQWVQTGGPAVTLADANRATASFTAPNGTAELHFDLTVTDPYGASHSDAVLVIVGTRANPTLTIVFDSQPDSTRNVRFDGTGGIGRFWLDDPTNDDGDAYQNRQTFTLPAGLYTIRKRAASGWFLTDISCDSGESTPDLATASVTVPLNPGDNRTCLFIEQRGAIIRGETYEDLNGNGRRSTRNPVEPWQPGWTFRLFTEGDQQVGADQVSNATGRVSFTGLPPGIYKLCLVLPAGWFNTQPNSGAAMPCYFVTVYYQSVTVPALRFGNRQTPAAQAAQVEEAPVSVQILPDFTTDESEDAPLVDPWLTAPETEDEEDTSLSIKSYLPLIYK